jgi:hypothetical protein
LLFFAAARSSIRSGGRVFKPSLRRSSWRERGVSRLVKNVEKVSK